MKNILSFIILFVICAQNLFAQYYVLGKAKTLNYRTLDYMEYSLYMLENQYYIELTIYTGDINRYMIVSYGSVRESGNLYLLKDIPTNAEIVLEKNEHSNLDIKKGFSFMKDEIFNYEDEANSQDFSEMIDFDSEIVKKKKQFQLLKDKQLSHHITLKPGKYKNSNICISLEENGNYKIVYMFEAYFCLISEGKWSKGGRILKLYDPFLDYSFTALIEVDEKLTVIDFPYEFNSGFTYSLVEDFRMNVFF